MLCTMNLYQSSADHIFFISSYFTTSSFSTSYYQVLKTMLSMIIKDYFLIYEGYDRIWTISINFLMSAKSHSNYLWLLMNLSTFRASYNDYATSFALISQLRRSSMTVVEACMQIYICYLLSCRMPGLLSSSNRLRIINKNYLNILECGLGFLFLTKSMAYLATPSCTQILAISGALLVELPRNENKCCRVSCFSISNFKYGKIASTNRLLKTRAVVISSHSIIRDMMLIISSNTMNFRQISNPHWFILSRISAMDSITLSYGLAMAAQNLLFFLINCLRSIRLWQMQQSSPLAN